MRSSPKAIQGTAIRLIESIVKMMATKPDTLTLQAVDNGTEVSIFIKCHPTDAKIIVGANARHLRALHELSKLLFWGSDRLVKFKTITSPDVPFEPKSFEPRNDWPAVKVRALVRAIARHVFADCEVTLNEFAGDTISTEYGIVLEPWPTAGRKRVAGVFSASVHVLFIAIGLTQGRRLYVELDRLKTARNWLIDVSKAVKCSVCGNVGHVAEDECPVCGAARNVK